MLGKLGGENFQKKNMPFSGGEEAMRKFRQVRKLVEKLLPFLDAKHLLNLEMDPQSWRGLKPAASFHSDSLLLLYPLQFKSVPKFYYLKSEPYPI